MVLGPVVSGVPLFDYPAAVGKGLQVHSGIYHTTPPTFTDGQIGLPEMTSKGILKVSVENSSGVLVQGTVATGLSGATVNPVVSGYIDIDGNVAPFADIDGVGYPEVAVANTVTITGTVTANVTKLATQTALSDTMANPTTTQVGAMLMGWNPTASQWKRMALETTDSDGEAPKTTPTVLSTEAYLKMWNGSSWDRVKGDTTSGLWVNIKNSSLAVTGTFWQTTQPTSIADGSLTTLGAKADAKSSATDTTAITVMQVLKQMSYQLQTPGTWTPYSNTALSNTKAQVKGSAGTFGGYFVHNPSAATTYIQVWDLASASVTVGTTAPTYVIGIPSGSTANIEASGGIVHSTGITVAATTTPTGSTAPASALVLAVLYK